ncbi:cobalt-factor II C(20)-methyltransferase [Limosilactobacillus sp. STM2_1]|uniref:Cobalt-factor II C(20)-methyltransferase n=1 Tax=Limosilactobacillus rudii TaxID=2759755 RepID=A0A7W3YMW4_9LACO|nr:cobalt-factor II C(20)-methyltransferase [Limosilactobacillus rudii]MBB1079427.1 cobalt-factor II C(20)-methyltransferase [Limosilactobacillus rudii]MBB1097473.1 cobalt-factor II C(20)-methyltransferase [Limosilactobacillus rudii]MCD7134582.1 cobalt-factor II C(20)-methyltransferase [Limosilactobacillus rudii]
MASFFGIGVGPGDSELLTIKAVNVIKKLDVLYVPQAHKGGKSVAEKIAAPYLPNTLIIKKRHFPMVKDWNIKIESWRKIADEIKDDVRNSQNVGFLTLGDPSVYSTFSYIADMLKQDIDVQTIAGISSFSQIAASLSIPLMLDEESLEIVPATADEDKLTKVIELNDNVIIMKIATNFKQVYQLLQERGLLEKTIVVENASMATQKVRRLADYSLGDNLPYFTTALLKKKEG